MKSKNSKRCPSLVAVASAMCFSAVLLAGCGGGNGGLSSTPTSVEPNATVQSPSLTTNNSSHTSLPGSWMDPAADAQNLLYVSQDPIMIGLPEVEVYSWQDRTLVGTLTGFVRPWHLCADKAGNVFVPDAGSSQIFEYAHGGTSPIATLSDPGHSPYACSSDAVTGDLAVVDSDPKGYRIAIYEKASGKPRPYFDGNFKTFAFCGYDAAGNLFVDGTNHSEVHNFILAELPKGGKDFTHIKLEPLNFIPSEPGSVQWDGKYLAIGDAQDNTATQFTITGSNGTEQGRTRLDRGEGLVHQFWIPKFASVNPQAQHIVGVQSLRSRFFFGDVGFWHYPQGGEPTHLLTGPVEPIGVTVSLKQGGANF